MRGLLITSATPREYFCNDCKQLRLSLLEIEPQSCRSCGSSDIIVGKVGELDKEKLKGGSNDKKRTL